MTTRPIPRVSVVVPTYNIADYIGQTLDSALSQSFDSIEIIVVDDCSTDDTADIVKDYMSRDSRVRYERLTENSNRPAVPRNHGIRLAQGEYVAFLDHDDLWKPSKLQRQVQVLDQYPKVALVHSCLWEFTSTSRLRGLAYLPDPHRRRGSAQTFLERNVVQCSSAIARTDVLRDLGGFDERPELRAVEDFDLWRRIAAEHDVRYISEIHGYYRSSPLGTSGQDNWLKRHSYLDEVLGTRVLANRPSQTTRVLRRVIGFPSAVYFHLVEGETRIRFGHPPHIW